MNIFSVSFPYYLLHKIKQSRLLSGALLLTAAGILTRIIGFFYRIYLSRTFGAESMGIYQLIGPVMSLAYSLTVAGFQTAISRTTAAKSISMKSTALKGTALKGTALKGGRKTESGYPVLAAGMLLSLLLSSAVSVFVSAHAGKIAEDFLLEPRCTPLLRILALSFPVSSIHACVSGFFYGRKSAGFPAFSQLFEQIVRVGSVLFLSAAYLLEETDGAAPDISLAVVGMVIGEAASAAISLIYLLYFHQKECSRPVTGNKPALSASLPFPSPAIFPELLALAVPLSAGRVIQNFLASIEAVAIPDKLRLFGLSTAEALSEYGVFTGMSLPFILFPTAFTGSVAVMLLPAVSEAQALHREKTIEKAVRRSIDFCLLLGFGCLIFFLLFGPFLGRFVFHQPLAGTYLKTLSFMCPFLYMNSTLASILHGLGKTVRSFFYGVFSLFVRLAFVFFCIPHFGMKAYLWALLASQILLSALQLFSLRKYLRPG